MPDDRLEFIQPLNLWTLYCYQHENAITINTHTYAVRKDSIAIVPPGARVANARAGGESEVSFLTFDMLGKGADKGVVPHVVHDQTASFRAWQRGGSRMMDTLVHLRSFVWHFMCHQSENYANHRADQLLYEAEAWVVANLSSKITVSDLARELKVTQRRLLKAFREEHDVTIQEYIIRRRIREASRLLITTDLQPKAIAARVGIEDLHHFNKLMRMHTGVSPRGFRGAYEAQLVKIR